MPDTCCRALEVTLALLAPNTGPLTDDAGAAEGVATLRAAISCFKSAGNTRGATALGVATAALGVATAALGVTRAVAAGVVEAAAAFGVIAPDLDGVASALGVAILDGVEAALVGVLGGATGVAALMRA
jgi:hypothetical protein